MKGCFVFLLLVANAGLCQQLQAVAPNSTVDFSIRNFGIEVKGSMFGVKGTIILDTTDVMASCFLLTADASTIDTGIALRNQHLKKGEYLDIKNHPVLRFKSTSVTATPKRDEIRVRGILTIKNTSKEIQVLVKKATLLHDVNFSGSFTIDRRDYMVGGASISLADEVKVRFSLNAKKD